MQRRARYLSGIVAAAATMLVPAAALAQSVTCINSYSTYQVKTYTLPPNTLNPGPNQHNSLQTNASAAQGDIGKTYFTMELTSFNDVMCAGGPCRNNVPGIAHRTWPLGSCVAVCNTLNKRCAVAIVMDRGPNTKLGCRTIDANPALQTVLGMNRGTVPATYQLLSLPPKTCEQVSATPNINVDAPGSVTESRPPVPTGNPVGVPNSTGASTGGVQFPAQTQTQTQTQAQSEPYCVVSTEPLIVYPYSCNSIANRVNPAPAQTAPGVGGASAPALAPPPRGISPEPPGALPPTLAIPSASLVIAQPRLVRRGDPVVISWTSVGMQAAAPCALTVNDSLFARSNEGSNTISVFATTPNSLSIVLSCSPISGGSVQKSTTVTIQ